MEANNFVEEVFNFWISKLDSLNFQSQKNKTLMALVAIICINPQNQNEKVKANISHLINGILSLTKQFKNKSNDKKSNNDNEEEELEEETDDKFNVKLLF